MNVNNSIAPTNNLESNRKWVNAVYLDYIVPQITLTQPLIDELTTLATSSPFVEGDAVYTARAIVGYDPEETGGHKSMIQDSSGNGSTSDDRLVVRVYPNPTSDFVNIEIQGEFEESLTFILINILGTEVLNKTITPGTSLLCIDIKNFKQGIYWYRLSFQQRKSLLDSGKLIINR